MKGTKTRGPRDVVAIGMFFFFYLYHIFYVQFFLLPTAFLFWRWWLTPKENGDNDRDNGNFAMQLCLEPPVFFFSSFFLLLTIFLQVGYANDNDNAGTTPNPTPPPLRTQLPCYIAATSANITTTMNGGNDDGKQQQGRGEMRMGGCEMQLRLEPQYVFLFILLNLLLMILFTVLRTKGVQTMKLCFIVCTLGSRRVADMSRALGMF